MKRLISLMLALAWLLSLAGCKDYETVKVEYDEDTLYTGGDIRLTQTDISPETETVRILVENGNTQPIMHSAYLVCDFSLAGAVE